MNPFAKFGKRVEPVDKPYTGVESAMVEEVQDDPLASLLHMEEQVSGLSNQSVGDPITHCERPWMELELFDEKLNPIPAVPYKVSAGGVSRAGLLGSDVLGKRGFIHVDDVNLDLLDADLEVEAEVDEEGAVQNYELRVVKKMRMDVENETKPKPELMDLWSPAFDISEDN